MARDKFGNLEGEARTSEPVSSSPNVAKADKPQKKKPPVKTTYRDPQTGEIKILGEE